MTQYIRNWTSDTPGERPVYGEIPLGAVGFNRADLQAFVGGPAPVDLLPIRHYSAQAAYVPGDLVVTGGGLYRAREAMSPGAFDPDRWELISSAAAQPGIGLRSHSTAQALRDSGPGAPSEARVTLGALAAGDGGGGAWRWDVASTADDNLGTVLLPAGHVGPGRWVRVHDGAAPVAAWGLVPEDASAAVSNTAAIEAAWAWARAQSVGAGLELPAGAYYVAAITLPSAAVVNGNAVTLFGQGEATILRAPTGAANDYILSLEYTDGVPHTWTQLRAFQIDGQGETCKGMFIGPSNNCRVQDVTILDMKGTGFRAERPYDLYATRLRIKVVGDAATAQPGAWIGQHETAGAGNHVWWTDCLVEEYESVGLYIGACSNFQASQGKIHGITASKPSAANSGPCVIADGATGDSHFVGVAFTQCRGEAGVRLMDVDGTLGGSAPFTRVTFSACDWSLMGVDNAASTTNDPVNSCDCLDIDLGDSRSVIVLDGCKFFDVIGTDASHVRVRANVPANTVMQFGAGNWFRDQDPTASVRDDRNGGAGASIATRGDFFGLAAHYFESVPTASRVSRFGELAVVGVAANGTNPARSALAYRVAGALQAVPNQLGPWTIFAPAPSANPVGALQLQVPSDGVNLFQGKVTLLTVFMGTVPTMDYAGGNYYRLRFARGANTVTVPLDAAQADKADASNQYLHYSLSYLPEILFNANDVQRVYLEAVGSPAVAPANVTVQVFYECRET